MPHRVRAVLLAALLLALALAGCNRVQTERDPTARPPAPNGPDVLLVTIDTLRADHVGAYGAAAALTPTLDGIASEGVLFETAIAQTPLTLPSHASILTGLNPPGHGIRHNGLYRLGAETETLAGRFQAAGYDTGAVVAAVVLAPRFGLNRGFDHYDAEFSPERAAATGYHERNATQVTDAALAWVGERDRPFFLWVHYYDPHAVYQPPAAFAERFPEDPYSGEVAYVDAELGRLLAALRQRGRYDNTLVAVTADHGESLGEHHEMTHSYTLYDATQRVPWLMRGPGIASGRRLHGVSATVDLAPTLLALAGLRALPGIDGKDQSGRSAGSDDSELVPGQDPREVKGEGVAGSERAVYAETQATRLDHGWAPLHAARSDRHLYVRAPRTELYDLAADPGQRNNLLVAGSADARATAGVLDEVVAEVLSAEGEASHVDLDADTRAQIQALGYALPAEPVAETGIDPKDALRLVAPFEYAKSRYQGGYLAEAERVAALLYQEMPSSPTLNDLLTLVYLSLNEADRAVDHAERGVELVPGSSRAQMLLGLARVAARDQQAALAAFERSVELDPDNAEAHAGLMWRARFGGSMVDAAQSARHAVSLQPHDADLRRLVADTWDQLGRYDLALQRYRQAVALDPGNGPAHLGIAVQTARMGDLEEVSAQLSRAGPLGSSVPAKMRVAIAYAGRGESARAEEILRSILDVHPESDGVRRVLALLLERTGRPEEAQVLRESGATL